MAVHVTMVGPAEDLLRVRCPKQGAVETQRRGLRVRLNDGRQVALALDGAADLAELGLDLLGQVPALSCTPEVMRALRVLNTWAAELREGEG